MLKVLPDTVTCDLPYFGRADQATPGSSEGGIKFTSLKFDYSSFVKEKGGREITIKPKDVTDVIVPSAHGTLVTIRDEGFIGIPQAAYGTAGNWEIVLGLLDPYWITKER